MNCGFVGLLRAWQPTMYSVRREVLAVQKFPLSAIVAVTAQLRVVRGHLVSDFEARNSRAHLHHDAARLVAGHNRHPRVEVSVVDVQIGPADAA